jgi:hypothetical protein
MEIWPKNCRNKATRKPRKPPAETGKKGKAKKIEHLMGRPALENREGQFLHFDKVGYYRAPHRPISFFLLCFCFYFCFFYSLFSISTFFGFALTTFFLQFWILFWFIKCLFLKKKSDFEIFQDFNVVLIWNLFWFEIHFKKFVPIWKLF